jgi:hypothetical protein
MVQCRGVNMSGNNARTVSPHDRSLALSSHEQRDDGNYRDDEQDRETTGTVARSDTRRVWKGHPHIQATLNRWSQHRNPPILVSMTPSLLSKLVA